MTTCLSKQLLYHSWGSFGAGHLVKTATNPMEQEAILNAPPPPGSRVGNYFLAYVRSQMNPHIFAKFGANLCSRLADFPHFFDF